MEGVGYKNLKFSNFQVSALFLIFPEPPKKKRGKGIMGKSCFELLKIFFSSISVF